MLYVCLFLILIGQNYVAEWLIVGSINHMNSNLKCPTNLSLQLDSDNKVLYTQNVYSYTCIHILGSNSSYL